MKRSRIKHIAILKDAILETIWPTRCVICEKYGYLLCPKCASKLNFIDLYKNCKKCGEPFAKHQCCACNPINNDEESKTKENYFAFTQCISVTTLNKETGKIITIYKDAGERRLSKLIAYFMYLYIPKSWISKNNKLLITYIPSSNEALTTRGFDHMQLIASNIADFINIPCAKLFENPKSQDQRKLGRNERGINMSNKFSLNKKNNKNILKAIDTIILIDDVLTTGATLNSASLLLKKLGINNIYCLTFSRTY